MYCLMDFLELLRRIGLEKVLYTILLGSIKLKCIVKIYKVSKN
jgi:hypothetical protein